MKKIELSSAADSERALRDGQSEEVVVLQNGRPVALVVPFDEDDLEWYAREADATFIDSIARAREQAKAGETLTSEQVKAQLGLR